MNAFVFKFEPSQSHILIPLTPSKLGLSLYTCSDPKVVLIAHMRKRFSFLLLPHTQTQTCKQEYGSAVWLRVP